MTEFTDTELAPGTKFYYRVRALPQVDTDADGSNADEGWSSTTRDGGASDTTHGDVPSVPQNVVEGDGTNGAPAPTITFNRDHLGCAC